MRFRTVVEAFQEIEDTSSPFHSCGRRGDQPGYALRLPRLVHGIRTDKAPTDAIAEREILDLYRMQRAAATKPAGRQRGRASARRARR